MPAASTVCLSKLVSRILRHRPDQAGLQLAPDGWARVSELLAGLAALGPPVSHELLVEIVRTSDKNRFELSEDGLRIRARHGHSVRVDLRYEPSPPPPVLFHGTVATSMASIRRRGLTRQKRTHVHLAESPQSAAEVGARRGPPIILRIRALDLAAAGHAFFRTAAGVWLVDRVPPEYLELP